MENFIQEFSELYVELLKIRKDESNSSHMKLMEDISIYVGDNLINRYVTTNKITIDEYSYISFKIYDNDFDTFQGNITENAKYSILEKMRVTLKKWGKV